MPNIKISELTAPIAVTDSDILPVVQSSVTRKITWGALKSTLAGALGRAYLGLGTASTANVTTSATDTTAGRVMKVGDAGILGLTATTANADLLPHGIGMYAYNFDGTTINPPLGQVDSWGGVETGAAISNRGFTIAGATGAGRVAFRTRVGAVNTAWREIWTSIGSNSVVVDTGSIGYGIGSGGTVTQATSKSTTVTLNKPSGRVTTTADSLAAGAGVSFQLTNGKIAATDIVLVSSVSGPGAASYTVSSWGVSAGFCYIRIENISAAAAAHAISINFVVIKGATA